MRRLRRTKKPRRAHGRKRRHKLAAFACGITIGVTGFGTHANAETRARNGRTGKGSSGVTFSRAAWPKRPGTAPPAKILDLALSAASSAINAGMVDAPKTLTVIDYSRPSTQRRLWVMDLKTGETLYHELVAHGQGSGGDLPTSFSNTPDSHQSSLGLFVTADTYIGSNGYSLRLDGLDKGFNDNARARAIVMHGAPYVSEAVAQAQGRLGRSWGCPALGDDVAREIIDQIKGGNLVFAYYPDQEWLNGSPLLAKGDSDLKV